MTDDLVFGPAVEIAARIRRREVSALEVVDAYIARIEKLNPALNAFVTTTFDRARLEARAADEQAARGDAIGPLHGVPVSIKDAINTADVRTVAGSKLFASNVPSADAHAVRKLRAAGAIVLGKTNVPECAMDWRTVNGVFGRTSNPWNPACSPGGSSGGEAAAVSAGCSAAGLGSDLGGSIRVPAHFCGIFGLRPTPGRVGASGFALPSGGTFSLTNVLGPLARTTRDLEAMFLVLAGFDPCDPAAVSLPEPHMPAPGVRGLRVAFCVEGGIPVTAEIRQAVERAARALESNGADVVSWTLPAIAEVPQVFLEWVIQPSLGPLLALYRGREDMMGPLMRGLSNMARPLSAERFIDAWSARDAFRRSLLDKMARRPVLVMPICSTAAFAHDQRGSFDVDGQHVDYGSAFGYAEVATLAGLPAVAVPAGLTSTGLPLGVQIAGLPFEEAMLLSIAKVLEDALGGSRRPPI